MDKTFKLVLALLIGCSTPVLADEPVPDPVPESVPVAALGDISPDGISDVVDLLRLALHQNLPRIQIVIDSPGGDVGLGLKLIKAMRAIEARGTVIQCHVDGIAASMAAVILQACTIRTMDRQASILFHTASVSSASGNAWELARTIKEIQSANDQMAIFVVGRLCIHMAEYKKKIADTDWWLGYEQAVGVCAIDAVL